ncbi:uncharacterized protein BDW43DRAFT_66959 [Aspergillus alliaceus]|uniref:uncharacterized protein n=1 Tax=Petromyces alliaceus TaxID=209559 RepID=UPI0012A6A070|nr:uncharacterized protein BDW43DRAFT_66959 [Aspergillus alliaceus]KAB8234047.1 hypothetical protein BDW43DRAFT_66959 [Aspergillus alliaceus]
MSSIIYPGETNGGTVTSFIPLTTAWPASSGCASYFRLNGPSLMAYDPGYGLEINTDVICGPPALTTWWEQGRLGGGGPYHTAVSIGPLTCPEDFSTVVSSVKDSSSTLAMCCPSEYYLADGSPGKIQGNCLSRVSSGMILTYASTPSGDSTAWKIVTTTLSKSSTVGAIAVVGWNIKFPGTTTSTTASTTSINKSTSASATPSISSEIATSTTSSTSGSDLTTGTKVGIGVGVGVGALGVIALLVALYFYTHRKERTIPDLHPQQPPISQANWQPALPAELYTAKHHPGEGEPPAELVG